MEQQNRPQRLVSLSSDRLNAMGDAVDDAVDSAIAVVKPKLRGWLHAGITPLALAAGNLRDVPRQRLARSAIGIGVVMLLEAVWLALALPSPF